jgi:hypothetical protein
MSFFQVPPPTRFDLRFSIAGIPVRVHPLFWVIALLFASGSNNLLNIATWIIGIFISILVHELGHALAFRRYGQDSYIVLHFAGGLTVPETVAFGSNYARVATTPNQQISFRWQVRSRDFSSLRYTGCRVVARRRGDLHHAAWVHPLPIADDARRLWLAQLVLHCITVDQYFLGADQPRPRVSPRWRTGHPQYSHST